MALTRNAWEKFKTQPEIWFFYGFLLTSPFSIRKVFFDYPLLGGFNEYSGIYLYLSDIFLGLAIGAWILSILYNKMYNLSMSSFGTILRFPSGIKMFHVKHFSFLRDRTIIALLGLPTLLVLWSFITIYWSNQPEIATYRSFKLFEFYLFYLFLALNPRCSTPTSTRGDRLSMRGEWNILRNAFRIIIVIGLINAIIGILQFILQHSVGLFWLKESLISADLPGVAKVVLGGVKYIRAYGLFPHPNILAGFLLLSIILTLAYRQIFTLPKHLSRSPIGSKMFHMEHFTLSRSGGLFALILGIQIVGGILTFSKSAFLGFILAFICLARNYIVSRGTRILFPWQLLKLAKTIGPKNRENSSFTKKWLIFLIISFILVVLIINPDFKALFIQPISERLTFLLIAKDIISSNFLTGIGAGQFVIEMQKYSPQALQAWQLQPVHNVFLLILSEIGLAGLSIFVLFLWKLFHVKHSKKIAGVKCSTWNSQGCEVYSKPPGTDVPRETIEYTLSLQSVFGALLIGFFVTTLFDHYLWDIQQGQIMLWAVLGLLASTQLNP
ncbi:MAG: hypothetical protein AAB487_03625 [Patescibacteria group bacterium]